MNGQHPADDLVFRIAATSGLPLGVARRIVEDVIAHHDESLPGYVARRHRELAAEGCRNAAIYQRLREEISQRLFRGPCCTVRQIRRMIYG
jgi:hypothetical protein